MPMKLKHRLPGYVATTLAILLTCLWTFWGTSEVYFEGWGLPFLEILRYLIFAVSFLFITLIMVRWPRIGGWAIILIGGAFTIFMFSIAYGRGYLTWRVALSYFPVTGLSIIIGVLFIIEGNQRRTRLAQGWSPPESWFRRNLQYIVVVGVPVIVALGATIYWAPLILARVDDGDRGTRLIEGNGITLVWAPQGSGWNWKQPWGGFPSWDDLALYGVSPIGFEDKPGFEGRHATQKEMEKTGLCLFLIEDGTRLAAEPQNFWRMPTSDEIIRSLVSSGENAGCTWNMETEIGGCLHQPNKDTPLWAPDEAPIYYWSADEFDDESAWYVPYTVGGKYSISPRYQPKDWGNPRHGYRCVREP